MTEKIAGFHGKDPKAIITKVMQRQSAESFIRQAGKKVSDRKSAAKAREQGVKEGILAALYAQHVLGQQLQLPGTQPPMSGGMAMGMDAPMPGQMPPPGMPGMGGPPPPPIDPNAPGLY